MYGVFMKSFKHGASRIAQRLLATAALAVLSACGGGTSQVEPFDPGRIIVFGDESSLIAPDGRKYGINAVDATTSALVCASYPNWIQSLAATPQFSIVFAECNPDKLTTPRGKMYATAGAKIADLKTRIDAYFTGDTFGSKDLVTVMAGANDVFELYGQFPTQSQASLIAEAQARGRLLGEQVNRIARAGGRVIVSTLPDLGLTPFAIKEKAAKTDIDRAAFISKLTDELNVAMRLALINDGRMIGLLLLDESSQAIARFPEAFGYANVVDAACLTTVGPLDCTSKTLVTNGSADTWLWATDRLLSPAGQSRLGSLAVQRAINNPF
jgi:outer membrane lipase/esterase